MAKKFLDQVGLTTLWNKIKSVFATKSESNQVQTNLTNFMNTKAKANGLCPLGSDTKVPSTYLPSYVDDVLEYASKTNFPATGEDGKIYVAEDTNKTYRWSGTAYVEISASLALGETSSTAYAGDKGKANRTDINNLKYFVGYDTAADDSLLNKINKKLDIENDFYKISQNTSAFTIEKKDEDGNFKYGLVLSSFENGSFTIGDSNGNELIGKGSSLTWVGKELATQAYVNTFTNSLRDYLKKITFDDSQDAEMGTCLLAGEWVRSDNVNGYVFGAGPSDDTSDFNFGGVIISRTFPTMGITSSDGRFAGIQVMGDEDGTLCKVRLKFENSSSGTNEYNEILDESMALTTSEIEAICV